MKTAIKVKSCAAPRSELDALSPLVHFAIWSHEAHSAGPSALAARASALIVPLRSASQPAPLARRSHSQSVCVQLSARQVDESLRLHTLPSHGTCLQRARSFSLSASLAAAFWDNEKNTTRKRRWLRTTQPCDLFCLFWVVGRVPHFFATESWLRRQKLLLTSECLHACKFGPFGFPCATRLAIRVFLTRNFVP